MPKIISNLKDKISGKIRIPKTRKGKIILGIGVLIFALGLTFGIKTLMGQDTAEAFTEYQVQTADIKVTVSGSGTVEPINMYNIVALVQGDVLASDFEEGDSVEKGQLLYVINASDMETTLKKSQISLQKAQSTYQDSADIVSNLSVKSEIKGKVGEVFIAKNDSIAQGSKIAMVYDDSSFILKVPFSTTDVKNLHVGQSVNVVIDTTFETIDGTIQKIYDSERILSGSQTVTDVEVKVENPGALTGDVYATVNAGDISCYEGGSLNYANEKIITASASGTVDQVYCTAGEYVKAGSLIAKMSSDSALDQYQNGVLNLEDAKLSYSNTQEQLDNYNIKAPIKGTIIQKSVKAGDILDSSSSSQSVMAVIADMTTMVFDINVDELDIAKMKKDQKVDITADALPDSTFTGYVENVGINGVTQDGVTSYPVKVVIDKPDGILPGMNVNAEIVVEAAAGVLSIPVSAVNQGNSVLVKSTGSKTGTQTDMQKGPASGKEDKTGNLRNPRAAKIPSGYIRTVVKLGISDASYIEVVSGLSSGDTILIPVEQTSSTTATDSNQTRFPGMGGGEPPSGGGGPPAN